MRIVERFSSNADKMAKRLHKFKKTTDIIFPFTCSPKYSTSIF
jgi:hypothetical protein